MGRFETGLLKHLRSNAARTCWTDITKNDRKVAGDLEKKAIRAVLDAFAKDFA